MLGELIGGAALGQLIADIKDSAEKPIEKSRLEKELKLKLLNYLKNEAGLNTSGSFENEFDFETVATNIVAALFDDSTRKNIFDIDPKVRDREIKKISNRCVEKSMVKNPPALDRVNRIVENCFEIIIRQYIDKANIEDRLLTQAEIENSNKNTDKILQAISDLKKDALSQHNTYSTSTPATTSVPAVTSTPATSSAPVASSAPAASSTTATVSAPTQYNSFINEFYSGISVTDRIDIVNALDEMKGRLKSIHDSSVRRVFTKLVDYSNEGEMIDVQVFVRTTGVDDEADIWRTLESKGLINTYYDDIFECKINAFSDGAYYWDDIKTFCANHNIDFSDICCDADFWLLD